MAKAPSYIIPDERYGFVLGEDGSFLARLSRSPTSAKRFIKAGSLLILIPLGILLSVMAFRWGFDPELFVTQAFVAFGIPALVGIGLLSFGLDRLYRPSLLLIDSKLVHRVLIVDGKAKPRRASFDRTLCKSLHLEWKGGTSMNSQRLSILVEGKSVKMRIANSIECGKITTLAEILSDYLALPLLDQEGYPIAYELPAPEEIPAEEQERTQRPVFVGNHQWPSFKEQLKVQSNGESIMRIGQNPYLEGFAAIFLSIMPITVFAGASDRNGPSLYEAFAQEHYFYFCFVLFVGLLPLAGIVFMAHRALQRRFLFIDHSGLRVLRRHVFASVFRVERGISRRQLRAVWVHHFTNSESNIEACELSILMRKGKDLRHLRKENHSESGLKKFIELGRDLAHSLNVPLLGKEGKNLWRPDQEPDSEA